MNATTDLEQKLRDLELECEHLKNAYRSQAESFAFLSLLSDFHADIKNCSEISKVLSSAQIYIQRLIHFRSTAFVMVHETNMSFEVTDCDPPEKKELLQKLVDHEISEGTFAWALRQNRAVVLRKKQDHNVLIFHVLATRSQILGMFVGILQDDEAKGIDISLNLLSVMLLNTAYAIENTTLYSKINLYNENLEKTVQKRTRELSKVSEELIKAKKLESVALLAGGIAHDFNNMLAVILGNVSLAKMGVNPEDKLHKRLSNVEAASARAKDLTHQLLTFSKGGAPIKKPVSIKNLILESVHLALRGSETQWQALIPESLNPVEIDEGQMRQVILNLTINAEQAMPPKGTIKVNAENIDLPPESGLPLAAGRYVKLSIQDTGAGIADEHINQIFDPYFTTKPGKAGLGLSITYSIVKKHGGHITVESKIGMGSTFSLYLPVTDKKVEAPPTSKIRDIDTQNQIKKARILIMDDEEGIREIAAAMLKQLGHETDFAINGEKAVELYTQAKNEGKTFDLVIMDLTIPGGMGGKEAIQKLLEIDPKVNAIVSSGYSSDPVMANHTQHGFKGVLSKPYELKDLAEILNVVLKKS